MSRRPWLFVMYTAMLLMPGLLSACANQALPTATPETQLPSISTSLKTPGSTATLFIESSVPTPVSSLVGKSTQIAPTVKPDIRYPQAEIQEDIEFLFRTLEEVHPNLYFSVAKPDIEQLRQHLQSSLSTSLTRQELFLQLAPLVTQLNDGHTYLLPPEEAYTEYLSRGGLGLPIRLMLFDQRAWVVERTDGAAAIPAGAELLAINDRPMQSILTDMLALESGERREHRMLRVQEDFDLLFWLLYQLKPPYTLLYRPTPELQELSISVEGITNEERRVLSDWHDMRRSAYTFSIVGGNIGLIDFRSFSNKAEFDLFLKQTFTQIQQAKIRSLIIDLRRNSGGDSRLGDALLSYITDAPFRQFSRVDTRLSLQIRQRDGLDSDQYPGTLITRQADFILPRHDPLRFDGDVYVLTSAATFSSAASFCAAIKDFQLGTLIGEETGGLATTFGDVYSFRLPHTGLEVGVSYKYFVRPSGVYDGHGVIPDYVVHTTPTDLIQGRDPVLEYAQMLIQ